MRTSKKLGWRGVVIEGEGCWLVGAGFLFNGRVKDGGFVFDGCEDDGRYCDMGVCGLCGDDYGEGLVALIGKDVSRFPRDRVVVSCYFCGVCEECGLLRRLQSDCVFERGVKKVELNRDELRRVAGLVYRDAVEGRGV